MKAPLIASPIAWFTTLWGVAAALGAPVSTTFTFQGQLKDDGLPVNTDYDMQFSLYDDNDAGNLVAGPLIFDGAPGHPDPITLTKGLFAVELNFGSAFDGTALWLHVQARPHGVGAYTALSPRQAITAAPYAIYALEVLNGVAELWTQNGNHVHNTNVGNVGIGTSSPAAKLHVASAASPTIRLQETTPGGRTFHMGIASADHSLRIAETDVADRLVIDDDGDVGIGTTSPAYRLDVAGRMRVRQNTPPTGSNTAGIWLYQETPGENRAFLGMRNDNLVGFYGTQGAGWGLVMNVADGKVGIGTENPFGQLGVVTSGNGSIGVSATGYYGVSGSSNNANGYGGTFGGSGFLGSGNALLVWGDSHLVGDVGIGTTSPAAKLHVVGGTDSEPGGGGYAVFGAANSTNISIDNNEIMARSNGGTSSLYVNNDGGDVVFGGAINIGYEIVSVLSGGATATAFCPAGKLVVGGGCSCGSDLIEDSQPTAGGTGWECDCDGTGTTARAICVRVK